MNQAPFFSTLLCFSYGKIRSLWLSQSNQQATAGPLGHPRGRSRCYTHRSKAGEERGGGPALWNTGGWSHRDKSQGTSPGAQISEAKDLLFLLPLAVRPAGRSFQKHRAPSLTSYSLSSLSHDTRRVLGRQSFMRSHFQSVQFCKCPRTCAVGRKWFKENQQLFCGGLVSGASWGPLSDLPWGVQLGGVRVWGACENQKKANEAAQAAASPGGERGSGCGHVEGGT